MPYACCATGGTQRRGIGRAERVSVRAARVGRYPEPLALRLPGVAILQTRKVRLCTYPTPYSWVLEAACLLLLAVGVPREGGRLSWSRRGTIQPSWGAAHEALSSSQVFIQQYQS